MTTRVQVILEEEERELFRHQAAREGKSLSGWLRAAGREKLAAQQETKPIRTVEELHGFFRACADREPGREPDWEEHRKVIERSMGSGESET